MLKMHSQVISGMDSTGPVVLFAECGRYELHWYLRYHCLLGIN